MSPQSGPRHLLAAMGVVVALMLVGGAIASLL
jgi:hypothetical protein